MVKPWSNTSQRLVKTPISLNLLQNFCHILQISPKHFKISQYKSCPAAFQIFEGHNFAFVWHFKFWVEKGEKLGPLQLLLFIGAMKTGTLPAEPARTIDRNIWQLRLKDRYGEPERGE
jgi:hypothetical protein